MAIKNKNLQFATVDKIEDWFWYAWNNMYSHLMVLRYNNEYDFPIYVSYKDSAMEMYENYRFGENLEILEVLNVDISFASQMKQYKPFNF